MTNFNLPKFLKRKKDKEGGQAAEFTIESYRRFKDGKFGKKKVEEEEEVAPVSQESDAENRDVPFDEMTLVPSESDTEYSLSEDDSEQEEEVVVSRSRRYRYRFYKEENKNSKKQDKRSSKKPDTTPKATYSNDNTCNPLFNLMFEVDECISEGACGNEGY